MKLFRGYLYGFFVWFFFLSITGFFYKKYNLPNKVYLSVRFTEHSNLSIDTFVLLSFPILSLVLSVFFKFYFKESVRKSFRRAFMFNLILSVFYFGNCMLMIFDIK